MGCSRGTSIVPQLLHCWCVAHTLPKLQKEPTVKQMSNQQENWIGAPEGFMSGMREQMVFDLTQSYSGKGNI